MCAGNDADTDLVRVTAVLCDTDSAYIRLSIATFVLVIVLGGIVAIRCDVSVPLGDWVLELLDVDFDLGGIRRTLGRKLFGYLVES